MLKMYDKFTLDDEKSLSIIWNDDKKIEPVKLESVGSGDSEPRGDSLSSGGFRRISRFAKPSLRYSTKDRRKNLEKKTCSGNFQKNLFRLELGGQR